MANENLYTTACRQYIASLPEIINKEEFIKTFDSIFDEQIEYDDAPDIVLLRLREDERRWIGFGDQRRMNPFLWKMAWSNPIGFPNSDQRPFYDKGIVVIEEHQYNEGEIYYSAMRYCKNYLHFDDPMSSSEVFNYFDSRFSPSQGPLALEELWWEDVYLPARLIDSVPESQEHSEYRGRRTTDLKWSRTEPREYLCDSTWEDKAWAIRPSQHDRELYDMPPDDDNNR